MDTWKALQKIKYKTLDFSVIDSKVLEGKAIVVAQTRIDTIAGPADQKDIFFLVKKGQKWLIDELEVTDEVVDEEIDLDKMEL